LQEQMHQQTMTATGMNHDFDMEGGQPGGPKPPAKSTAFDLKRQPPANAEPGGMLGTQ
jgi:hypothetical protein